MSLRLIPDVVDRQELRSMCAHESAESAARTMVEYDISAVVVTDEAGTLAGIVTERDLTRRVVAEGNCGAETTLGAIMTAGPTAAAPGDSPSQALAVMRALRVRHLPVVDDGRVVAVVSMRDLQQSVSRQVVAL